MKFEDAIDIIEERKETIKIQKLKNTLKNHLKKIDHENYLEKAKIYYYLLQITLKSHKLYESQECKNYQQKVDDFFLTQEKIYNEKISKRNSKDIRDKLKELYLLIEKIYSSLEVLYIEKAFNESKKKTYEKKMEFRKKSFRFQKRYWRWFEYFFLEKTSNYGDSFFRWGLTSFLFAMVLASIYGLLDYNLKEEYKIVHSNGHFFDYMYFSIVTLTTLGIGDFIPKTFLAKFFVSMEVFFGFIMLGIFITLIQRKL